MKRLAAIMLTCGIICVSLTGCGRPADKVEQESISAVMESDVVAVPGIHDDNLPAGDNENTQELGEDYVYDYQVSMEPIPKEIADLGGPCQGTIHAFPSKIVQGLTQKQVEKDLELKKEVEETIPQIEQYLADNIGGQFIVDGLEIRSETDWSWICTEVSTGDQFSISYVRLSNNFDEKHVFLENYYNAQITKEIAPDIEPLIPDVFGECFHRVLIQGSDKDAGIYIAQLTNEDVNKIKEQEKILSLWKKLQDYDSDRNYNIFIIYLPESYQEVVDEKFQRGDHMDMRMGDNKEIIKVLLQVGEIKEFFYYYDIEIRNSENGVTLNEVLEQRKLGMPVKAVWEYWISADLL